MLGRPGDAVGHGRAQLPQPPPEGVLSEQLAMPGGEALLDQGVAGLLGRAVDEYLRALVILAVDAKKALVDAALTLTVDLCRACGLVAEAAMLSAGYHRPSRHTWRAWRHGRRVLAGRPG